MERRGKEESGSVGARDERPRLPGEGRVILSKPHHLHVSKNITYIFRGRREGMEMNMRVEIYIGRKIVRI
eukprot:1343090-Amorphochlora_amoeboformis.AAC.1